MGRVLAVLQTGRGPRPLLRSERHLPPPQPIVPADLGGASPRTAVVGELGGEGDILTGLTLGRGLGELRPGPKAHQNLPPPLPFPSWQTRAMGWWLCLDITQQLDGFIPPPLLFL